MINWKFLPFVLLMTLIGGAFVLAQSDDLTINTIDDELFPELRIFLTVPGDTGGLTADDFGVTVNGESTTIENVETIRSADVPISVVLVIDTSSSMSGSPLESTKSAALQFLDNLSDGDEVALVSFANRAVLVEDFTTDLDNVASSIQSLTPNGRTALYDAVAFADGIAQNASNPAFVVFLTDGNEYGGLSSAGRDSSINSATESDNPFFVIGLGYSIDIPYLSSLSTDTGGEFYESPEPDSLENIYSFLADSLRTQYVLTIDSGLEADGNTADITVSQGSRSIETVYTPDDLRETSVEIVGLPENVSLDGDVVTIDVLVTPVTENVSYEFMIDGEVTITSDVGSFDLDPFAYPLGEHTLTITTTVGDESFTGESSFIVLPITNNSVWTPRIVSVESVEMVLVPAGCFQMGGGEEPDQQPAHDVCIQNAFWLDQTPLTNQQYGSTGLYTAPDNPRDRINWFTASEYCTSRGGRLPTEAEWEYAARGPDNNVYPWGNDFDASLATIYSEGDSGTLPAGSNLEGASWVGALDMSGNVWEWTSSLYMPYPYDATDGRENPIDEDGLRVLRGGSVFNSEIDITTTNRYSRQPTTRTGVFGVRCVLDYQVTTGGTTDDS